MIVIQRLIVVVFGVRRQLIQVQVRIQIVFEGRFVVVVLLLGRLEDRHGYARRWRYATQLTVLTDVLLAWIARAQWLWLHKLKVVDLLLLDDLLAVADDLVIILLLPLLVEQLRDTRKLILIAHILEVDAALFTHLVEVAHVLVGVSLPVHDTISLSNILRLQRFGRRVQRRSDRNLLVKTYLRPLLKFFFHGAVLRILGKVVLANWWRLLLSRFLVRLEPVRIVVLVLVDGEVALVALRAGEKVLHLIDVPVFERVVLVVGEADALRARRHRVLEALVCGTRLLLGEWIVPLRLLRLVEVVHHHLEEVCDGLNGLGR